MKNLISPAPWTVERTNSNGWKGIGILDANGLAIAYMVMQPGSDNEMANARAIVAAVNGAHGDTSPERVARSGELHPSLFD